MFSKNIFKKSLACLIALLTVSGILSIAVSPARAQQSIGIEGLKQPLHSMFSSIDQSRTISLAQGSSEFQSQVRGHMIQFHSISLTWSSSRSLTGDSLTLDAVNVVFSYREANGGFKDVVTTLDSSLTKIVNVKTQESFIANPVPNCLSPPPVPAQKGPSPQNYCDPPPPPPPCTPGNTTYGNWAGYTLKSTCNGINFVYEAQSAWTIPAVAEPWTTACQWYHCDLSIWPGLTNFAGGSNYIAQLGSQSGVYCGLGACGYYYSLWYEFYPDNSAPCVITPDADVNPGDQINADVWNEIETGGSSNNWDFLISDTPPSGGTSHGCFIIMNKNYPLPQEGQFIAERPDYTNLNYYARLPTFSSFTMTAVMNQRYAGQTITGYTAYNNKWYTAISMSNCDQNGCHPNLTPSAINGASTFTINYVSSTAT